MRLIDADALKRKYEEQAAIEHNKHAAPASWSSAFETVAEDIEMAVIDYGWISVKDRLPGNEFVLVSVVTKNTGHRWETPTIGEIVHGKWFLETEGTIADNVGVTVTHWMPLPEPPVEVSGDAN